MNPVLSKDWPYKPNTVQIETVQGCNRRCSFCGTRGIERKFYFADIQTISHTCKLIKEAELNCRILLAGHGEPTLHPKLPEIVQTIRNILPNNTIHLFTNGTIIQKNPELVIHLFGAGLNDLVFDEYRDSRIGVFVRGNEICNMFQIVEQGPGIPLFADKNAKKQRICITPPIDGEKNTANRKLVNHCGAGGKALKQPLKCKCSTIFRDFYIRWDGNISICCDDFRGQYHVTNILGCKSLHEAYFHPRLEAARRFIMINNRRPIFPCRICNVKPIRPGLLPDSQGQVKMKLPTAEDYLIVSKRTEPLAKIVKREWE